MSVVSSADICLRRLVEWIRPRRPKLGARTTTMFEDLRAAARAEAGVELLRFAYAGSIEKGTGLRMYRDRECRVPGQAADLVVELAPGAAPDHETYLRLAGIAERCFAGAGAAVADDFRRDRLRWRLLPILAQRGDAGFVQLYLSPAGGASRTAVRVHTREVRARTRASVEQVPGVAFNDCVRLLKWWRHARPPAGAELSSFALERLAAAAFDALGVGPGYAATLAAWAEWLASFDAGSLRDPAGDQRALLIDWSEADHRALARWFAEGAEHLREAIATADAGEGAERLALELFGPAAQRG